MSDHDYDLDDNDGTDQDDNRNPLRAQLRKLEKRNKELETQVTEGQKATRELAFVRAGVNPTDKKAAYFIKGYDGDLTPEAIKAAAEDAGFLEPPKTEDVVSEQEKQQLAEIDRATSGGSPAGQADDLQAQMTALYGRKDLTPQQAKAQLDALVAQAGLMPTG